MFPIQILVFPFMYSLFVPSLVLQFALTREKKRIVLLLTSTARPTMFDPYV